MRRGRGGRIVFRLERDARVVVRVERRTRGRRVGGRCSTRARRGRRCAAWVLRRGSLAHAGRGGANTMRFAGRIGGARLPAGSYRFVLAAAGEQPVRAAFTVVR
jgi:hypothetical protein